MSSRTAESNKAANLAWKKEQQLVREGKGTRDWTPEQQRDILIRGKAYDENGKAFEAQHMRSVEMHPEYQGNPNNIQFLTREEHLAAHGGDWRNPTNGYYDPVSKTMIDFGDGPIVPCQVIELSNPVAKIEIASEPQTKNEVKHTQAEEKKSTETDLSKADGEPKANPISQPSESANNFKKEEGFGAFFKKAAKRINREFTNGVKVAGRFMAENKEELAGLVGLVTFIGEVAKTATDLRGTISSGGYFQNSSTRSYTSTSNGRGKGNSINSSDNFKSNAPESHKLNYPETHASPREHMVSGHGQYYNTKEGKVWKDKGPYQRGGKHSNH